MCLECSTYSCKVDENAAADQVWLRAELGRGAFITCSERYARTRSWVEPSLGVPPSRLPQALQEKCPWAVGKIICFFARFRSSNASKQCRS